jgi:hypothetical protein
MVNGATTCDTHHAQQRNQGPQRLSPAISFGKNGAQMSAQKYFPKIHQWQLRQTAFWISA